jgi:hypothetical protein
MKLPLALGFTLLLTACGQSFQSDFSTFVVENPNQTPEEVDHQSTTDTDPVDHQSTTDTNPVDSVATGRELYSEQCSTCHGVDGRGQFSLASAETKLNLAEIISTTMPFGNVGRCDEECGIAIASFIQSGYPSVNSSSNTQDETEILCSEEDQAKPRSLRLLTQREYQNTIDDIFNSDLLASITETFPGHTNTHGYDNNAESEVLTESRMNSFWTAAEDIAQVIVEDQSHRWLNCNGTDSSCLSQFVSALGFELFRRPLIQAEIDEYIEIPGAQATFEEALHDIARALLMSPHFLYRSEMGTLVNGRYVLDAYETATLLSYNFIGSSPDQALYEAAARDELKTSDQLRAQVTRLLKQPRAKSNMVYFAKQWFSAVGMDDLAKDADHFPAFNDDIAHAMVTEFELFVSDVMLGTSTSFSDLLTADYVYVNRSLAEYYGLSSDNEDYTRVYAGTQRGGILKMGALMSTHASSHATSPINRGQFVRERLMCQELPQPPENSDLTLPSLDPTKPTRERFEAHTESEECAACHKYMDGIGFALENYDAAGMYRVTEAGRTIDTSGVLLGLAGIDDQEEHSFRDIDDIISLLEGSSSATECVVDQFERFTFGIHTGNQCTVRNTAKRWQASGYNFQQLWLEMVSSEWYLVRQ